VNGDAAVGGLRTAGTRRLVKVGVGTWDQPAGRAAHRTPRPEQFRASMPAVASPKAASNALAVTVLAMPDWRLYCLRTANIHRRRWARSALGSGRTAWVSSWLESTSRVGAHDQHHTAPPPALLLAARTAGWLVQPGSAAALPAALPQAHPPVSFCFAAQAPMSSTAAPPATTTTTRPLPWGLARRWAHA
jgi:hypothetical protein